MKYEKEFRQAHPETIGETDSAFDMQNYIDWLDAEHEKMKSKAEKLPISDVSVSDSQIEELFPFEDENNATPTRPAERIAAYNSRQADRREGARRLLGLLHSR